MWRKGFPDPAQTLVLSQNADYVTTADGVWQGGGGSAHIEEVRGT